MSFTVEAQKLRHKLLIRHENIKSSSWTVSSFSKSSLTFVGPIEIPPTLPRITLWLRVLGRDTWKAFDLINLRHSSVKGCEKIDFDVLEPQEFARCFDFSRLSR